MCIGERLGMSQRGRWEPGNEKLDGFSAFGLHPKGNENCKQS